MSSANSSPSKTCKTGPVMHIDMSKQQASSANGPLSPSSALPTTILESCEECLVSAIVLCYWDNILGPRIRHLWLPKEDLASDMVDTLRFIATQTLGGEICRNPTDCHVDTKYFVLEERRVAVNTFVFGACGNGDYGVHSLSLIIPLDQAKTFLQWQDLCRLWLLHDVARLRVLMEKDCDNDTMFHPDMDIERVFLCRAITSHLVTCGCSVVIGKKTSIVNSMLATLGLFLSASERRCSRFVKHDKTWPYCPDLYLQGALQSCNGSLDIPLKDIHLSHYPSSLIDVTSCTVKFTGLPHQHRSTRHETSTHQLSQLWCGHTDSVYPLCDMFHLFDEPETLITNLVQELYLLPANIRLLETYVCQFMNSMDRRALALTHYIDTETNNGKHPNKLSVKRLRQDLSLKVPGDFYIVLACAEKLKPGIYEFVMGDAKLSDSNYMQ